MPFTVAEAADMEAAGEAVDMAVAGMAVAGMAVAGMAVAGMAAAGAAAGAGALALALIGEAITLITGTGTRITGLTTLMGTITLVIVIVAAGRRGPASPRDVRI